MKMYWFWSCEEIVHSQKGKVYHLTLFQKSPKKITQALFSMYNNPGNKIAVNIYISSDLMIKFWNCLVSVFFLIFWRSCPARKKEKCRNDSYNMLVHRKLPNYHLVLWHKGSLSLRGNTSETACLERNKIFNHTSAYFKALWVMAKH